MTCFNFNPNGSSWGTGPWQALLDDVRKRMTAEGRFVIKFNREPESGRFYSSAVRQVLREAAGFRTRFFFDYAFMEAR